MPNFSRQTEEYRNARRDPYWENVIFYSRMEDDPPTDISQELAIITLEVGCTLDESNFKFGTASIDWDAGVDADMTIPHTSIYDYGSEPFTFEFWVRFRNIAECALIARIEPAGSEEVLLLRVDLNSGFKWEWYQSNTGSNVSNKFQAFDTSPTIVVDTWYHVAVVKDDVGTLSIFRDGTRVGSHSTSITLLDSTSGLTHFGNPGDVFADELDGQMDEVRFTRGVARYTENFIPQRSEWAVVADLYGDFSDPYWDHVVFQTGFDTKDVPHDQSTRKHVLTLGSGTTVDTTDLKFGESSFDLDSSVNGYVSAPDSDDWHFGAGDFTVECWVKFDDAPAGGDDPMFLNQWDAASNERSWYFGIVNAEIYLAISTTGADAAFPINPAWTPSADIWYHIAASRRGTDLSIYIDGVQLDSVTNSNVFWPASGTELHIGTPDDFVGISETQKNIDGVRITKGIGRYTEDFTPPTRVNPTLGSDKHYHKVTTLLPLNEAAGNYTDKAERSEGASSDTGVTTELTAANLLFDDVVADIDATDNGIIIIGDPAWSEVVFVTHMDHDPPIDVSKIGGTITDGGAGATIDTVNNQFGKACWDFDGSTTGHLSVANDTAMQIGTQDYCLELWFQQAISNAEDLLGMGPTAEIQFLLHLQNAQNDFEWFHSTNGTSLVQVTQPAFTPNLNQWYHGAVTRQNGWVTLYIDGKALELGGAVPNTDDLHASTAAFTIATRDAAAGFSLDGKIEDVRFTVGHGRYFSNFRVPTRALGSAETIPADGEFTLEGWVRWEADPGTADAVIASQWNEAQDERGWQVYLTNNLLRFAYSTDGAVGTVVNTDETWNPAADTWYHWAICRTSADELFMFIDGVQLGTEDSITATFYDSSAIACLGETEDHVTGSTQMYQSNVRFTKGFARYTADFAPPTGPFATKAIDLRDFEGLDFFYDPSSNDYIERGRGSLWDNELAECVRLIDISDIGPVGGDFSHNAENVTASERPTVLAWDDANALNERTTLEFDGSTQLLRMAFNALDDRWEGEDLPMTVAMAVQAVSTPANDTSERFISFSNTANADTQFSIGMGDVSGTDRWRITRDDDAGTGPTNVDDVTGADTNPHILIVVFHGTTVDLWVDGVLEQNGVALNLGVQTINEITIGAANRNDSETEHANFRLGEIAVWNRALGDNDAELITEYLTAKWIS